jgi:hypothetical protein
MTPFLAFFSFFVFAGRRRMASRFYPTQCEMKALSQADRREDKRTKEKLKNPQQPTT